MEFQNNRNPAGDCEGSSTLLHHLLYHVLLIPSQRIYPFLLLLTSHKLTPSFSTEARDAHTWLQKGSRHHKCLWNQSCAGDTCFRHLSWLFSWVLFHFQWVSTASSSLLLESFHIWDPFTRSLEHLRSTNLITWMCPFLCDGYFLRDRHWQYTSVSGYGIIVYIHTVCSWLTCFSKVLVEPNLGLDRTFALPPGPALPRRTSQGRYIYCSHPWRG